MATLNPTSMTTATTSAPQSGSGVSIQEFKIRVPKNLRKKHHVMRFNATLNVDFAQWSQVKMERENNMKEFKGMDDDQPKFGAGSEFGREAREEARRKKFGIVSRKYKPDDQPWILKVGGKNGKKFKGIREGGVSENAAYYVFTHAPDGAIDAYPLYEWYNFQPIQRYKALSAEEAEQEFGRRNKVLNYFNLMFRKRMRGDEAEGEVEDPDDKKAKNSKSKELKISDMDEWMDSDDNSSDSAEDKDKDKDKDKEDSDSNSKKKKNKKKAAAAKKKKKVQDEAGEESDDGDEEGRERDYISDSSESESDREGKANKELKSVAEEDALRKLLTSDEDSDEEEKQKSSDEESKKEANEKAKAEKGESSNKKDKAEKDTSSDLSSDSDNDAPPKKSKGSAKSSANSRSNTPIPSTSSNASKSAASHAASLAGTASSGPPSKKPRFDPNPGGDNGVTEQAVRRYLARKPMTTTELLTKFKQRKSGVSSDRLVETMTQILKKINPVKQMIKGKMYLSIKP